MVESRMEKSQTAESMTVWKGPSKALARVLLAAGAAAGMSVTFGPPPASVLMAFEPLMVYAFIGVVCGPSAADLMPGVHGYLDGCNV